MLDWLRSLFAWRTVRDTGVWVYRENTATGARSAFKYGAVHQPMNDAWLSGVDAEWTCGPVGPPPSSTSSSVA